MIENTVREFLASRLLVPVGLEKPENGKGEYVVVEKTGGSEDTHIYSSVIAIQSYADSLYAAAVLNEKVKEHMPDIVECVDVTECKYNTDYNFTDPTTKAYRYQVIYQITHY